MFYRHLETWGTAMPEEFQWNQSSGFRILVACNSHVRIKKISRMNCRVLFFDGINHSTEFHHNSYVKITPDSTSLKKLSGGLHRMFSIKKKKRSSGRFSCPVTPNEPMVRSNLSTCWVPEKIFRFKSTRIVLWHPAPFPLLNQLIWKTMGLCSSILLATVLSSMIIYLKLCHIEYNWVNINLY